MLTMKCVVNQPGISLNQNKITTWSDLCPFASIISKCLKYWYDSEPVAFLSRWERCYLDVSSSVAPVKRRRVISLHSGDQPSCSRVYSALTGAGLWGEARRQEPAMLWSRGTGLLCQGPHVSILVLVIHTAFVATAQLFVKADGGSIWVGEILLPNLYLWALELELPMILMCHKILFLFCYFFIHLKSYNPFLALRPHTNTWLAIFCS